MKPGIRLIYLYLFSLVGLSIVVIGLIRMADLGLKFFIFKEADNYEIYEVKPVVDKDNVKISTEEAKLQQEELEKVNQQNTKRQKQRDFSNSMAMILIGTPLYFYHWNLIKKENK